MDERLGLLDSSLDRIASLDLHLGAMNNAHPSVRRESYST